MARTEVIPEIIVRLPQQLRLCILVKVRIIRSLTTAILGQVGSEHPPQQPIQLPITQGCNSIVLTIIMRISHSKITNILVQHYPISTLMWIQTKKGSIIINQTIITMGIHLNHLILIIMVTICLLQCLIMITTTITKSMAIDTLLPCLCTIIILSTEVSWKEALLKRWREKSITEGTPLIMVKGDRKATWEIIPITFLMMSISLTPRLSLLEP